ncbi:hypothetical protein K474DRAFT_942416 [Panus rudis PR-1116 ss-1]|nr:hypothetical protein K474DRAFT_942416 [Panus rudis PR-1116 ss-1]
MCEPYTASKYRPCAHAEMPDSASSSGLETRPPTRNSMRNRSRHPSIENLSQRGPLDGREEGPRMKPCSPTDVMDNRYNFRPLLLHNYGDQELKSLPAMCTEFHHEPILPWQACEHPEGKLYFKRLGDKPVFTHSNVYDEKTRIELENGITHIRFLCDDRKDTPEDVEIVVDVVLSDEGPVYNYYLASWMKKAVMWLEDVQVDLLTKRYRPVCRVSHCKYAAMENFWKHVWMFPADRQMDRATVENIRDELTYGAYDVTSSELSIFPFDAKKLNQILRAVEHAQDVGIDKNGFRTCVIDLCGDKFLNYYGQPEARLNRDDSLFEPSIHRPRSIVFKLLLPFLFWMPNIYLIELDKIWIDQSVNYRPWNSFINELKKDWKYSTTPATVLLSTNVGFLAIQSLDPQSQNAGTPYRNIAQIASYISTMLALCNLIICQVLTRQHRRSLRDDAGDAMNYLSRGESISFLGLEAVALTFSLPNALFIWSMLTFLLAIAFICFDHTSLITRITMGIVLFSLTVVCFLIIWRDWGMNSVEYPTTRSQLKQALLTKLNSLRQRWDERTPDKKLLTQRLRKKLRRKNTNLPDDIEMNAQISDSSGRQVDPPGVSTSVPIFCPTPVKPGNRRNLSIPPIRRSSTSLASLGQSLRTQSSATLQSENAVGDDDGTSSSLQQR